VGGGRGFSLGAITYLPRTQRCARWGWLIGRPRDRFVLYEDAPWWRSRLRRYPWLRDACRLVRHPTIGPDLTAQAQYAVYVKSHSAMVNQILRETTAQTRTRSGKSNEAALDHEAWMRSYLIGLHFAADFMPRHLAEAEAAPGYARRPYHPCTVLMFGCELHK
jgi:hypothetical protein